MKSIKILFMFCFLAFNLSVSALVVPVDPNVSSFWNNSRSTATAGEIVATGGWDGVGVDDHGFQIQWDIALSGGVFNYLYTISGEGDNDLQKSLSHWILEVTNPALMSDFTDFNRGVEEGPKVNTTQQGNTEMPSNLYGLKDETDEDLDGDDDGNVLNYMFSFNTKRAPVWGDFYAKDGNSGGMLTTAYNVGFGTDPVPDSLDFKGWIARPNGANNEVPESSSIILLALGIIGFLRMNPRKL